MVKVSFDGVVFTCHRCWQRINTAERVQPAIGAANEDDDIPVPPAIPDIQRNLARASNTASHCIFNNCSNQSQSALKLTCYHIIISTYLQVRVFVVNT